MSTSAEKVDRPIFIIGAGRSGTTMIREALMQHSDIAAFEFEMNYLWRYGHADLPHDLLCSEEHLNPDIISHIQHAFFEEAKKQNKSRVLDKTVANVMRPIYLQAVFPDALILHVIRDGRAVTASAMKRWATPQPAQYFLSKLQTIPVSTLPRVSFQYLKNSILAKSRGRKYRQSWGPRWLGIDEAVKDLPLAQVCARQWVESVKTALAQKENLKAGSYMEIKYEDLVQEPELYFEKIRLFFHLKDDEGFSSWVKNKIDAGRRDKWLTEFTQEELALVNIETLPLLKELAYQ